MARKKGLQTFNLSLIRYLMREQSKTTLDLCAEIEVSEAHLSRVLNGHSPLSEDIGRKVAQALGVSWEVVKQPESLYMADLINLSLVDFFHKPGALDWKNAVRLADKMGILKRGTVDSSEPTDAEVEDADLLALGDAPAALMPKPSLGVRSIMKRLDDI